MPVKIKAAVYGRSSSNPSFCQALKILLSELEKAGAETLLYERLAEQNVRTKKLFTKHKDLLKERVKFLFCLGGDGTMLETLSLVRDSGIPVIGINTGRLGFLAMFSQDEIELAVDLAMNGKYVTDNRILLEMEIASQPAGRTGSKSKKHFALNEITVQKADSSAMLSIRATVNGTLLNTYYADGLIIATPTGSTAYSLSCGGPVVVPHSESFIITAIAPHNLNVRTVVISSADTVVLKAESRNGNFLVSSDSYSEIIPSGNEISIRKAGFYFSLVKAPGKDNDYFSTLRNKLIWGVDKRN